MDVIRIFASDGHISEDKKGSFNLALYDRIREVISGINADGEAAQQLAVLIVASRDTGLPKTLTCTRDSIHEFRKASEIPLEACEMYKDIRWQMFKKPLAPGKQDSYSHVLSSGLEAAQQTIRNSTGARTNVSSSDC